MNSDVQVMDELLDTSKGRFLIAASTQLSPRLLPSPNPAVRDLLLEPFEEIVIDPAWLDSPLMIEQVQKGNVEIRRDHKVPIRGLFEIAEEYKQMFRPHEVQFIYLITNLPITDQVRDNIRLADNLGPKGTNVEGSRVTKAHLKGKHIHILKAALELEQRHQNRTAVKKELNAAIKKIEALA